MPGMRCGVAVCDNSRVKAKQIGQEISFYRFPKSKELLQIWVQRCRRNDKWNPSTSRICGEHFCAEDFERDLQAELLGGSAKKKLKSTAVPSRKLFKDEKKLLGTPSPVRKSRQHIKKRKNQEIVRNLFAEGSANTRQFEEIWVETPCFSDAVETASSGCSRQAECETPTEEATLSKKCEMLIEENNKLRQQLLARDDLIKEMNAKMKALEKDLSNLTSKM